MTCTKCLREWIAATRAAVAQTDTGNLIDLDDMAALTERLEHCTHGATTTPRPSVLPPSLSDEGLARLAFEAHIGARGMSQFLSWVDVTDMPDEHDAWIAVAQAVRAALKGEK